MSSVPYTTLSEFFYVYVIDVNYEPLTFGYGARWCSLREGKQQNM